MRPRLVMLLAIAVLLLAPASARADPQPLWKSFPVGRQPLIARQDTPVPATPREPERPPARDGDRAAPSGASTVDTLVIAVSGVLGVGLLLAMVAVLASGRLANRRTS